MRWRDSERLHCGLACHLDCARDVELGEIADEEARVDGGDAVGTDVAEVRDGLQQGMGRHEYQDRRERA